MKTNSIKKYIAQGLLCCGAAVALGITSCKEDIDESNLYTFTGETIEDYLANRSERFSSFNYILSRIGYDKILSAYGTYTCFAPDNDAIAHYLDSLYNDTVNVNVPHNGLTAPGIEGLGPENPKADSLCQDIALFHLLGTRYQYVDRPHFRRAAHQPQLYRYQHGQRVGKWCAARNQPGHQPL